MVWYSASCSSTPLHAGLYPKLALHILDPSCDHALATVSLSPCESMQCCSFETYQQTFRQQFVYRANPLVRLQTEDELANLFRQRGLQPLSNTSLWACLGRLVNYKDGKPVSHDTLAVNTGFLMLAGYETTAHLITWALLELAADPALQVTCNAGQSHVHACIHTCNRTLNFCMNPWICKQACGLL